MDRFTSDGRYDVPSPSDPVTRADVLAEASGIVHNDRNSNYGDPEDNFGVIAELMQAYLTKRFGIRIPIEPYDVANLMFTVKLGRLAHNPLHHDSYVDMAGYAAAGAEVASHYDRASLSQVPFSDLVRATTAHVEDMLDITADTMTGTDPQ